jgi:hypothetical protein
MHAIEAPFLTPPFAAQNLREKAATASRATARRYVPILF